MLPSSNKIYDYYHHIIIIICMSWHLHCVTYVAALACCQIYCGCLNSFKHYLTTNFKLNENVIKIYLSIYIIISERLQLSANYHLMKKLLLCELLFVGPQPTYAEELGKTPYIQISVPLTHHRKRTHCIRYTDALKCDSILSVSGRIRSHRK